MLKIGRDVLSGPFDLSYKGGSSFRAILFDTDAAGEFKASIGVHEGFH
jgi:hypothetical protein